MVGKKRGMVEKKREMVEKKRGMVEKKVGWWKNLKISKINKDFAK